MSIAGVVLEMILRALVRLFGSVDVSDVVTGPPPMPTFHAVDPSAFEVHSWARKGIRTDPKWIKSRQTNVRAETRHFLVTVLCKHPPSRFHASLAERSLAKPCWVS